MAKVAEASGPGLSLFCLSSQCLYMSKQILLAWEEKVFNVLWKDGFRSRPVTFDRAKHGTNHCIIRHCEITNEIGKHIDVSLPNRLGKSRYSIWFATNSDSGLSRGVQVGI